MRAEAKYIDYKTVIFDLDGTLLDTSPGIFESVRYAESIMGLPPIDDLTIRKFLGPPPKKMYADIYGLPEDEAHKATRAHRLYGGKKAIYQASKYEGMDRVLEVIHAKGVKISVATLKKQTIAEKILTYFGLSSLIDVIVGMDDAETLTKSQTIIKVMEHTNAEPFVMVGDSLYDYDGAMEAGVDFIGVTYGFGFAKGNRYPFQTADKPADLLKILNVKV